MLPVSPGRYLFMFGGLALAALVVFAACDGGDGGGEEVVCTPPETGSPVEGVPELADGVLNVGSEIFYAPFEFYQTGTEIEDGLDIDFAKCLAQEMGVAVEFINTGFDGLIPELQTGGFDVIMSAMTIRPDREEQIDFVPYITVGTGILVPSGNPDNIQGLEDLCGLTVAVQLATIQVTFLEEQNQGVCADNNVDIVTFDSNPLAVEELRTGGADANFSDFPVAFTDAEESDGALEVVPTQVEPEPYGIGVAKESPELKDAIAQALQGIIDNGDYDSILAKWDLESVALQ